MEDELKHYYLIMMKSRLLVALAAILMCGVSLGSLIMYSCFALKGTVAIMPWFIVLLAGISLISGCIADHNVHKVMDNGNELSGIVGRRLL